MLRPFKQVDVFTAVAYRGNPVAVVLDGIGLSPDEMQRFTNWTNLSEATFVLPPTTPEADYRVRIFSPAGELPFAGHPTLGTCHAWLEAGGKPRRDRIVQECGVGLVELKRDSGRLAFKGPPLRRSGPVADDELAVIARGLGVARGDLVDHAWCDNGPPWRAVRLATAEQVLALKPDPATLAGLFVGVVAPATGECAFEVRAFFPGNNGMTEDPVTGSLNAALAQWMSTYAPPRYVVAQGTALGRAGRVHVQREADEIWIGGASITCLEGTVAL